MASIACLFMAALAVADEPAPAPPHIAFGPYCGLRSLYAATRFEGGTLDFASLLKFEYLGSTKGSSAEELIRAARDNGFWTAPIDNISENFLGNLRHPLILHVKPDLSSKNYDHFIVCLRSVPGGVRVLDAPDPVVTKSLGSVLAITDGIGIVVSSSPINDTSSVAGEPAPTAVLAGIALITALGLAVWSRLSPNQPPARRPARYRFTASVRQAFFIALLAIAAGFGTNTIWSNGLLASSGGQIADPPPGPPYQTIDRTQLLAQLAKDYPVIVDARHPADYAAGHIPGAINISVDASDAQRRDVMRNIPLDHPVVIYCQSSTCPYAPLLAAGFRSDGRSQLMLYRGGWLDWSTNLSADASPSPAPIHQQ
jgi:rhodanese-related sulfurtransferase